MFKYAAEILLGGWFVIILLAALIWFFIKLLVPKAATPIDSAIEAAAAADKQVDAGKEANEAEIKRLAEQNRRAKSYQRRVGN